MTQNPAKSPTWSNLTWNTSKLTRISFHRTTAYRKWKSRVNNKKTLGCRQQKFVALVQRAINGLVSPNIFFSWYIFIFSFWSDRTPSLTNRSTPFGRPLGGAGKRARGRPRFLYFYHFIFFSGHLFIETWCKLSWSCWKIDAFCFFFQNLIAIFGMFSFQVDGWCRIKKILLAVILIEHNFTLYRSIALEELYNFSFWRIVIEWSVETQTHKKWLEGFTLATCLSDFGGNLRLSVLFDRVGLKRLLIEHSKSYRMVCNNFVFD